MLFSIVIIVVITISAYRRTALLWVSFDDANGEKLGYGPGGGVDLDNGVVLFEVIISWNCAGKAKFAENTINLEIMLLSTLSYAECRAMAVKGVDVV